MVLECVGTQESMMQAIRSIRPGGWLHPSTSGSGERGDAPDFVEVGEAGIAMDDAMRR